MEVAVGVGGMEVAVDWAIGAEHEDKNKITQIKPNRIVSTFVFIIFSSQSNL